MFYLIFNIKQELQNVSPQSRQSSYQPNYAILDRYPNISARGPCIQRVFMINLIIFFEFEGDRTAVRLTGEHRRYDYINANEIKVIY